MNLWGEILCGAGMDGLGKYVMVWGAEGSVNGDW